MREHDGDKKGFTHLSRAWYGSANIPAGRDDRVDDVTFGFYAPDGGTSGEMSVRWVRLTSDIAPKLVVFNDAWHALAQFKDVIDRMGELDGEAVTPERFCELLVACGFEDMTPTESPYAT